MESKGCIFDFDGTMVDSMWIWDQIGVDFYKKRGLPHREGFAHTLADKGVEAGAQYLIDKYQLQESVDDLLAEWVDFAFQQYSSTVMFKPGLHEFVQQLRSRGIKTAIATSQNRRPLEAALANNQANSLFDYVITCNEVTDTGKQTPAVYLAAAEGMGLDPADITVFEDSIRAAGVAKSAGFNTVGVRDLNGNQDVSALREVTSTFIEGFEAHQVMHL